jgi:aspartate carbamoyltransferase catalytic subunit
MKRHILSAEQFTRPQLEGIFISADIMRERDHSSLEERRVLAGRHMGRQLISLFYEPSTRTRLSFELAAAKQGIGYVSTENAREFSSAAKGETLEDTIRVLGEYNADLLVMRHHETGAAARAAAVAPSHMSVINAGDGKGEHPTQALLDAYTIREHLDRLSDANIVLGGDLRNGRTARSLAKLLARYPGNEFTFVSTPGFEMGDDVKGFLDDHGARWSETSDTHAAAEDADVVYWTRLQRERLEDEGATQEQSLIIDQSVLDVMNPKAVIMHPLPRVGEITTDVDNDPRAQYFRQAGNGLYVRMALLDHLLGNEPQTLGFDNVVPLRYKLGHD